MTINERILKAAIKYARELITLCSTTPKINRYTTERRLKINSDVCSAQLRALELTCHSIDVCPSALILRHYDDVVRYTHAGNCQEYALLIFNYFSNNYPKIRAEVFYIQHGDHVVTIINRKAGSILQDPSTWGKDCWLVDAWSNTYYKAKDYRNKLRDYSRERTSRGFFNRTAKLTQQQKLIPYAGFCSSVIKALDSGAPIHHLYANFNRKLSLIVRYQYTIMAIIDSLPKKQESTTSINRAVQAMNSAMCSLLGTVFSERCASKPTAHDLLSALCNPGKQLCLAAAKTSYLASSKYLTSLLRSLIRLTLSACNYQKPELIDLDLAVNKLIRRASPFTPLHGVSPLRRLKILGLNLVAALKQENPALLRVYYRPADDSYVIDDKVPYTLSELSYAACLDIDEGEPGLLAAGDEPWYAEHEAARSTSLSLLMARA